jgi:hypothetical protein
MDVRKIAAEKKAKALAELKQAEEMERAADEIERLAAAQGWDIDIIAKTPTATVVVEAKKHSGTALTRVSPSPKKGGKAADPNSPTSRSKSESVKIIRGMKRPVPLGELMKYLALAGVVLGGKNPNQALSANLGHCPELVSTKRGWWLADEPLPPETPPVIGGKDKDIFGLN